MEQKQAELVLNGLVDLLENKQGLIRTRKGGASQTTQSDKFKYPNDDKSKWYEFEQHSATFRMDCDELKQQDAISALDVVTNGLFKIVVIAEQAGLRALSVDAFDKAFDTDVEVNVFDRLSKSAGKPVSPDKVKKQLNALSTTAKAQIVVDQLRNMGKTDEEINEFLAAAN